MNADISFDEAGEIIAQSAKMRGEDEAFWSVNANKLFPHGKSDWTIWYWISTDSAQPSFVGKGVTLASAVTSLVDLLSIMRECGPVETELKGRLDSAPVIEPIHE